MRRPGAARRQRGSVTVLVGAMSLILVAFVGLSVDGGEIQAQQRESQNAADSSALAAATALINASNYGYLESDARTIGKTVAAYTGIPTTDVTLTFQDSTGADPNDPTQVVTVKSDVSHTFGTIFLPVMNISSASVAAHAVVTITQNTTANCGLCSLAPTASGAISADSGGIISVSGGAIKANSTGTPAISVSGGGAISATGVTSVGSVSGATTPAAVTGPAQTFTDPLATVPVPTLGLPAADVVYSANTTINPGTYGAFTVNTGVTVTMRPGVYIFGGVITINGALNGSNVMLYPTCETTVAPIVSTPCTTSGNNINVNGTMTVSAPSAGSAYTGLVLFADRLDSGTLNVAGTITPTGTIYGKSLALNFPHGSHGSLTSRVIVGSVNVTNGGRLAITYTSSGNYVAPGKLSLTT